MASTKLLAALLIATALLLLSHPLPPVVAGTGGVGVCEKVECGKGKCVASKHSAVGFVCKCDAGWLQSALDGYTDGNDFLPCVYPNCSLDLACASSNSPFPAPMESPPAYDRPLLNPCRWVNCESGSCKMKSAFDWSCECPHGFFNINANPAFPCFSPCVLGSDCSKLGATLSNSSSSSPFSSSPPPSGGGHASSAHTSQNDGGASIMKKMKLEWGLLLGAAVALLFLHP